MTKTALEGAVAVQLNADIALASSGNGGIALGAPVDVCAGEGDVCGLVLLGHDADGVRRRVSDNDGIVVRNVVLGSLGHLLPVIVCDDGNVSVGNVPLPCQGGHRQTGGQHQGGQAGKNASVFHGCRSPSCFGDNLFFSIR